jgi:hypothetical protein
MNNHRSGTPTLVDTVPGIPGADTRQRERQRAESADDSQRARLFDCAGRHLAAGNLALARFVLGLL